MKKKSSNKDLIVASGLITPKFMRESLLVFLPQVSVLHQMIFLLSRTQNCY